MYVTAYINDTCMQIHTYTHLRCAVRDLHLQGVKHGLSLNRKVADDPMPLSHHSERN